ncbi:MAG: HisA/HisF-related TIM barrel protein [Vicinamibacterales bacterium]
MLIPSIDLKGGRIVQLVQGRSLALESTDVDGWIARFADYPVVQLIDLDGAMESGGNLALVQHVAARLPCRVGGGVRTPERARLLLNAGARAVIVGSALYANGEPAIDAARTFADAVGTEHVIGAVDSLGGRVVVRGWTESTGVTAVEAVQTLSPYCGGFLYTHVDTEGLMKGIDMDAVRAVRAATARPLAAAGGITTRAEVEALQALGVDAVVGMAIYTGVLAV